MLFNLFAANDMHWTGKVGKIAFTVFGVDVAFYGIIVTSAMLLGLLLAIIRAKKVNIKPDLILELFLVLIPTAIVFARLGFVMVRPEYFSSWEGFKEIFNTREGGLTITIGMVGGILAGFIWAKIRKVDFLTLADAALPIVLACQALGRWGNFFNQEIYGAAVTNPSWQFFPYAVFIARRGGFYQATFFYESIMNLTAMFIILFINKRLRVKGSGGIMYLIAYPLIRFIMEFMRDDGSIYDVVNYTQITVLVIFVAMSVLLTVIIVKKVKDGVRVWYKDGIPKDLVFMAIPLKMADGATAETLHDAEVLNPPKKHKDPKYNKSKKGKRN